MVLFRSAWIFLLRVLSCPDTKGLAQGRKAIARLFAIICMGILAVPYGVSAQQATDSPSGSQFLAQSTAAGTGGPGSAPEEEGGFFKRLGKAYLEDWKGTADNGPEIPRRGYPSPVDAPPYPFSDWPYGGSPVIGEPDTSGGPLTTALYGNGAFGDALKRSRIKIYGWVNLGFNLTTSRTGKYANAPAAYYQIPNSVQLDQFALYFQRVPDTVQTDHFDWGFRFTNLYGLDYRFTTAKGILSDQLLKQNNTYGYDPVMAYVDLYWGQVANGMNIRIGRYISLPDIEAQLAPDNYTYSHSLLYSYDAYTQQGVNATVKLSNAWMFQVGVSVGNDVAPWITDRKLTGNVCLSYTWSTGKDNLYVCDNSINDEKYGYNNMGAYYATWYHKFDDSSWHMATEAWYMWTRDVPSVSPNAPNPPPTLTNANGAFCPDAENTCRSSEWAIVNYLAKEFSKTDYLIIRNEYFDDSRGQRTGVKTRYNEHLLMWGHWIGSTVLFRPELRFEHAWDNPAYSSGTKKDQFVVAGDVIFKF